MRMSSLSEAFPAEAESTADRMAEKHTGRFSMNQCIIQFQYHVSLPHTFVQQIPVLHIHTTIVSCLYVQGHTDNLDGCTVFSHDPWFSAAQIHITPPLTGF